MNGTLWIVTILAAIPLIMTLINLTFYRRLPIAIDTRLPAVSVLIPARNEQERIAPVLRAVLDSKGVEFEVIVGDDSSTDGTRALVENLASADNRLRLVTTPALPQGWCGKPNACQNLARHARHNIMVFLDADVTVSKDGLARMAAFMQKHPKLAMLSGFPRQVTESFFEKLVIPLIHFVLLGYLPFAGMRFSSSPMFATACGQLIAVRREAYEKAGGHAAIATSIHDGVHLPRVFRAHGFHTDLADVTDISSTRMYETFPQLMEGLLKNAHEGMATPIGLPVWTVLLGAGHVLPPILLAWLLLTGGDWQSIAGAALATGLGIGLRLLLAMKFDQSFTGAILHHAGVAFLLYIQWLSMAYRLTGRKISWKARDYSA